MPAFGAVAPTHLVAVAAGGLSTNPSPIPVHSPQNPSPLQAQPQAANWFPIQQQPQQPQVANTNLFPLPTQLTPFSNTVGVGLRPQATGAAGVANPFRALMFTSAGLGPGAGLSAGVGMGGVGASCLMPVLVRGPSAVTTVGPGAGASLFGSRIGEVGIPSSG